jgi:hypothetical protein
VDGGHWTDPAGAGRWTDGAGPAAQARAPTRWRLVHHETFDAPFPEPAVWVEDTYGDASPYHVDAFDDDGEYFQEHGGEAFRAGLASVCSFRKSKSAEPDDATTQNGVYSLSIVDYDRPAPHNNVFIHHHRKAVLDTDNNIFPDGSSWSSIYSPAERRAVQDGDHYFGMFLLDGTDFGPDRTGNKFISYSPEGWKNGTVFVDKYLDGEAYVVSIERDDVYTLFRDAPRGAASAEPRSRTIFSRARSFRFALRTAADMNGANSVEKPLGSPRFRSVIRVAPPATDSQV